MLFKQNEKGMRYIMNLLIFFAIPFATILLAIVLEKILDNPILVAITFFGVYLIIIFALFAFGVITDLASALIAIIIYTIIAFITAYIVRLIKCICDRFFDGCKCGFCSNNSTNDSTVQPINNNPVLGVNDTNNSDNGNLLRISCRCNNGNSQELLSVNSNCPNSDDNDNTCGCCGNNNNNNQNNRNCISWKYYT